MKDLKIPFSFLEENNIILSDKEVDFAISRKLINFKDLDSIIDKSLTKYPDNDYLLQAALDILLEDNSSALNIQYTGMDYKIENRIDGTVITNDDSVNNKWKYIIILWLFNNRENNDNDYDKINTVYADFGYPSDMEKFVSYMPIQESNENQGYKGILDNWKDYLEKYSYLLNS